MIEKKEKNDFENCFELYMTEACHLCDDALAILNDLHEQMLVLANEANYPVPKTGIFRIGKQDITDHEALFEAYGKRIPVLIFVPTGDELAWPFDIQQAYEFIFPRLKFS